jgi:hypothetical protein
MSGVVSKVVSASTGSLRPGPLPPAPFISSNGAATMHITQRFVWVDELPFGAAVARRDDEAGEIFTYLSRAVSEDELAAGLSRVASSHLSGVYELSAVS